MKRHAVIVALKAEHHDWEIAHLLKVASSFVVKVCKELEAADVDSTTVDKHKTPGKGPNTTRTSKFIWKVQKIINKNPIVN